MENQKYKRIVKSLNSVGKLIPAEANPYDYIEDLDQDFYLSIYEYDQSQYEHAEKMITKDGKERRQGVAGITDVTCKSLIFDVDSGDLEKARQDTIKLVDKLAEKGVKKESIQISFSGNKGFSLVVDHNTEMTPQQHKEIALGIAQQAEVKVDAVIYNSSRVFRLNFSRHPVSQLYKTPLSESWLRSKDIEFIKGQAKQKQSPFYRPQIVKLPDAVLEMKPKEEKKKEVTELDLALGADESGKLNISDIDLSKKPQWLTPAKYLLQNGVFTSGNRNSAFMILASTYKNQGFTREICYRMLKGTAELQHKRTKQDAYSNDELWNNVCGTVYAENWKGGQYGPDTPLLQETVKIYDLSEREENEQDVPRLFHEIAPKFKSYIQNIEKNVVKTGIATLDKNIFLSTGANVLMLGAPGSGKSSWALSVLRNTSANGMKSVFASLDMSSTRIYEKILYTESGLKREDLYQVFKDGKEGVLTSKIEEKYKNVYFYDKSQPSVDDIRNYILKCQEHSGEKIKVVMIDYFERVFSEANDETSASKKVAGELQNLVNDLDICLITLVQPNKMSGDMSQPILSYNNIKGSTFLAQSARVIMSLYREGFSPKNSDNDKYMTINVLKNDLGEPGSYDFCWQGARGEILEMNQSEKESLHTLRSKLKSEKEDKGDW